MAERVVLTYPVATGPAGGQSIDGRVHTDWDDGSGLGLSAAAGDRWDVLGWRVTAGEAGYDVRPDGWCPALSAWV